MLSQIAILTLCFSFPTGIRRSENLYAVVQAVGIGHSSPRFQGTQARLMARRAAEVRAVADLAGKLGHRPGERIRGFRYVKTRDLPGGRVEVTVEARRMRRPGP